tara:strand:+ start:1157 stop:2503 length:1347 start_codon:yes stop_codon:yes gene_type:complete
MSVANYQNQVINKIKDYLIRINKSSINTSKSALCYFVGWDLSTGLTNIRSKIDFRKSFTFFLVYLRDLMSIGYQHNYNLISSIKNFEFENMVITWAEKKSFNSNGSLNDTYTRSNSRKMSNTLWLVIYMDFELPKNLDKNIIILKRSSKPNFNLFYLFKTILKIFLQNSLNLKKVAHYASSHSNFGNIVLKKTKPYLSNKKLKKIFMPYEAQPFQQMIISFTKKNNKKIKILGYIHDFEPITPNLIYKKDSPDLLLLPGKQRKKYFSNHLNWPKKRIKTIPSLRYYRDDFKNILKNKILLPSGIYNIKKVTEHIETFLSSTSNNSLKPIKVRIHPSSTSPKLQKKLKENIDKIIIKNKNKFSNSSKNKDTTIVIGITSLLIIALENRSRVIQICMDPEIQAYSKFFSSNIVTERLDENIFSYSLKKKENCFSFGNKKNSLNKIIRSCR